MRLPCHEQGNDENIPSADDADFLPMIFRFICVYLRYLRITLYSAGFLGGQGVVCLSSFRRQRE